MPTKYVTPEYRLSAFNCPHCDAYSKQDWLTSAYLKRRTSPPSLRIKDIAISICELCGSASIWVEDLNSLEPDEDYLSGSIPNGTDSDVPKKPIKAKLVYPTTSTAPIPADDMPVEIKADYIEAREIFNISPRGAAALLRLCVQKLMPILGGQGKNINDDIALLVKNGLPVQLQQALDSVRVIGNEAVHPGTLDLNDNREIASALFGLLNVIVERMITQQNQIRAIYTSLPQKKLAEIAKRDSKT